MHAQFRAVAARVRHAALGFSALALAACADLGSLPTPGGERAPVVNGEVSPRGGIEDAVLLVRTVVDGGELVCSSSLVAPNLVITARHCVSHLVRGLFTCTAQGELVSEDAGAGTLGTHLPAESLEFYSDKTPRTTPAAYGKEVLSTLSETICVNDLAFVVLDRALDLPVLPLRLGGRAERDEPVTLVGYGLDDAMSETESLDVATQPRTHNDTLVIADVGPDVADAGAFLTAPPRTLVVDGPAGCLGDSGGPLMARETGAALGIYSLLGGTGCLAPDAHHLFAHVPVFEALISDAFALANAEPTPEPSTSVGGSGGGSEAGGASGEGGMTGSSAGAATAGAADAGAPSAVGGAGGTGGRAGAAGAAQGEGGATEPALKATAPSSPRRSGCGLVTHDAGAEGQPFFLLALLGLRAVRRGRRGPSVAR